MTWIYACRVPDDHRLDHVISGRQTRHLVVGGAVAFGTTVALLAIGIAVGQGTLLLWAAAAGALVLVYVYGTFSSARAYTRFGAAGVRTRGLWGGTDEYRWDEIANVAVQQVIFPGNYRTGIVCFVVVTTKAGDHVRLGAPVSRTGAGPEFSGGFRQIRAAWQRATGIVGTPETAAPTWSKTAALLGVAVGVQVLALVVIFVTLPYFVPAWAAHAGNGRPGVFTAAIRNCPQRGCSWFGTFTTGGSRVKYATLEPGSPVIRTVGQSVAAVDSGRKGVVYPIGGGTAWELPTSGVTAGTSIVLLLFAVEMLVPIYRRRARHRRAALAIARPPPAHLPAQAFDDGGYGPSASKATGHHLPVRLTGATTAPEQSLSRASRRTARRRRKLHS